MNEPQDDLNGEAHCSYPSLPPDPLPSPRALYSSAYPSTLRTRLGPPRLGSHPSSRLNRDHALLNAYLHPFNGWGWGCGTGEWVHRTALQVVWSSPATSMCARTSLAPTSFHGARLHEDTHDTHRHEHGHDISVTVQVYISHPLKAYTRITLIWKMIWIQVYTRRHSKGQFGDDIPTSHVLILLRMFIPRCYNNSTAMAMTPKPRTSSKYAHYLPSPPLPPPPQTAGGYSMQHYHYNVSPPPIRGLSNAVKCIISAFIHQQTPWTCALKRERESNHEMSYSFLTVLPL